MKINLGLAVGLIEAINYAEYHKDKEHVDKALVVLRQYLENHLISYDIYKITYNFIKSFENGEDNGI